MTLVTEGIPFRDRFLFCGSSLYFHARQHNRLVLNTGNAARKFRGQAGSRSGKTANKGQIVLGQRGNGLVQIQQPGHGTAAKNITGTGGIDGRDLGTGRAAAGVGGLQKAALGTQSDHRQRDTILLQQLVRPLLRGAAPQEFHLVVADLHHIGLVQAPQDLLFRFLLAAPQRLSEVGVAGDELPLRFGVGNRLLGGGADRLGGQAQGPEMEHLSLVNERLVHFLPGQLGVRAGLPGEGEGAVAGLIKGDEGEGGEHRGIHHDALGLDPGLFHRTQEQRAEGIGTHLAQKGGLFSIGVQCGQKIAGSAAGLAT